MSRLEQYKTVFQLPTFCISQIIIYIRHIIHLHLSFIISTCITLSLPLMQQINFLPFKYHMQNFWNGPFLFRISK